MNPSTSNKLLIPAVIVIVALILVGGVYWIHYSQTVNQPQAINMQNVVTTPAPVHSSQAPINASSTPVNGSVASSTATSTAGWKTYTNSQYGFSFQYPTSYQAQNPDSNLMKLPNKTDVVELYGSPDNIFVTYASGSVLNGNAKQEIDNIYYDTTKNQWTRTTIVSIGNGRQNTDTTAITPSYGSSGLAYFSDDSGISVSRIIPLSHSSFVIIGIADNSPEDESVLSSIAATFTITN